jgi:hypothetical protein
MTQIVTHMESGDAPGMNGLNRHGWAIDGVAARVYAWTAGLEGF